MPYKLHCDKCDRMIGSGERFLEYRMGDSHGFRPVVTLCVADAQDVSNLFELFERDNWAKLIVEWRESV